MDFDAWEVDLDILTAYHEGSGFQLTVAGSALSPTGVSPQNFPEDVSPMVQARLLRCGVKAIANAAKKQQDQEKLNPALAQDERQGILF